MISLWCQELQRAARQYARQELNLQPLAPEAQKSDSQKAA